MNKMKIVSFHTSFHKASCLSTVWRVKLARHPGTDAATQDSLYIQGPRRTFIFLKGEQWNNSSHKALGIVRGQRRLCLRFCLFACLLATQQHEALGGFPSPALIHLAMKENTPVTWHLLLHLRTRKTRSDTILLKPNGASFPLVFSEFNLLTNHQLLQKKNAFYFSCPDLCRGASGTMRVALAVSHTEQLLHNTHYITPTITAIHFLSLCAQIDQSQPSMHYDIIRKVIRLIRGSLKKIRTLWTELVLVLDLFQSHSAGYILCEHSQEVFSSINDNVSLNRHANIIL